MEAPSAEETKRAVEFVRRMKSPSGRVRKVGQRSARQVAQELSSGEREDAELRTLVRRLIPVVKTRVLRAAERSPETLTEEIWTSRPSTRSRPA